MASPEDQDADNLSSHSPREDDDLSYYDDLSLESISGYCSSDDELKFYASSGEDDSSDDEWLTDGEMSSSDVDVSADEVPSVESNGSQDVADSPINKLPPEVLQKILGYLSFHEVAFLRKVSKGFQANCGTVLNNGFKKVFTDLVAMKKSLDEAPRNSLRRKFIPVLCFMANGLCHYFRDFCYLEDVDCFFPGKVLDVAQRVLKRVRDQDLVSAYENSILLETLSEKAHDFFKDQLETASMFLPEAQRGPDPALYGALERYCSFGNQVYDSDLVKKIRKLRRAQSPWMLIVFNLDPGFPLSNILSFFSVFGELQSARLYVSYGNATVTFRRRPDAIKALDFCGDNPLSDDPEDRSSVSDYGGYVYLFSSAPTKLKVANLVPDITVSFITELFSKFGSIQAVGLHHDQSGKSLGTAFVVFHDWDDAVSAMKHTNSASVDGRQIRISLSSEADCFSVLDDGELVLSNLDPQVKFSDINELFSKIGKLQHASVQFRRSGKCLGAGIVKFIQKSDALEAMEQYQGFLLKGRPIRIEHPASSACESVESEHGKLIISGVKLPIRVSHSYLTKVFSRFGKLRAVLLSITKHFDQTAKIVFDKRADGLKALKRYKGFLLRKRKVKIRFEDRKYVYKMHPNQRLAKLSRSKVFGGKKIRQSSGHGEKSLRHKLHRVRV